MAYRSEEARLKAEANFKKKEQQAQDADKVWAEQAVASRAADDQRARLKALRLAKEAAGAEPKAKHHRRPGAPAIEALAREKAERGLLPAHRPVPVKGGESSSRPTSGRTK